MLLLSLIARAQDGTALVRHAPTINGRIEGSVQQMTAENTTLNGGAAVTGDLLVPGTPTVRLNGNPNYGGTLDGTGAATPANRTVTLNGNATLRHVIRRTDPVDLPSVAAPPAPTGTRSVSLNNSNESPGDFATLKNLTLNSNVGPITVPSGSYGNFTANGGSSFVLGTVGATTPSIYGFQNLTLNSTTSLQVVGPVIVIVDGGFSTNGAMGSPAHPEWLALRLAGGGLTLNGSVSVYAQLTAPDGTLTLNGNTTFVGTTATDRLTINGNSTLRLLAPTANQPPIVALTAPSDGVTITLPAIVTLTAEANDPDGTIAKVEFFANGTSLGLGAPIPGSPGSWSLTFSPSTAQPFSFIARATDNLGATTDSAPVTITAVHPNQPPTVALTAPLDGTLLTAPATLTLTANAGDPDGTIFKVEFYAGPTKIGEDFSAPHEFTPAAFSAGTYRFAARAIDNLGAATDTPPATVTVVNPNLPPEVALTAPPDGATFTAPATLTLTAAATDPDGNVTKVEFFQDGAKVGETLSAPFTFTLTFPLAGSHTLTARATDNAGSATDSAPVTVTVVAPNQPPTVTLVTPADGATHYLPASLTVSATASDPDGTIAQIEFLANGSSLGLGTPSVGHPDVWSLTFSPSAFPSFSLVARATDNLGASATSSAHTVLVQPAAAPLPFVADFESTEGYQPGPLAGQLGWSATPGVNIIAHGNGFSLQEVSLAAVPPPAEFSHELAGADVTPVFVDFLAKPVAAATPTTAVVFRTTAAQVALVGAPPTAAIMTAAADGTGGIVWQPTGITAALDSESRTTNWLRLTTREDYATKRWDLYADGRMIVADVPFTNFTATALTLFGVTGHTMIGSAFDDFYAGAENPIAADTDRDGMDDAWETAHGLNPALNDRTADPDADGLTNIQEYILGTDPHSFNTEPTPEDTDGDGLLDAWENLHFGNLNHDGSEDFDSDGFTNRQEMLQGSDPKDFFNGGTFPGLQLVSGNDQSGIPGEFLLQPLLVQIIGSGGQPVPNVPVTFTLTHGVGGLAAGFGSPTNTSTRVQADANGQAKAFFQVVADPAGTTPTIEAAITGGGRRAAVVFTVQTSGWFPDANRLVVELNAGETTTRGINLYNPTDSPVTYTISPSHAEAQVDYTVLTSDEAGGPAFVWDDIRSQGARWLTKLSLSNDGFEAVDLSFAFPYYGNSFGRIFVNTNGYLTFDRGVNLYDAGDRFPSIYNPGNIIAPFWTDLYPPASGEIYFLDKGDRVIVQYEGLNNSSFNHTTVTFQVVLFRNGDIQFIYKSLAGNIDDAVVGMQNASGDQGVTIQEWENVVKSNYTVAISPVIRWLAVSPASGKLLPAEHQGIAAVFDATQLDGGTYTSNLALASDYPGKSSIEITAALVVNSRPAAVISSPSRAVRILTNQSITVTGMASDAEGPVAKVEYYLDGTKLGESTALPYSISWSGTAVGAHELVLHATDLKGAAGNSKPLTITVDSDTDGDGLGDEWEMSKFGNLTQLANGDPDQDGVPNIDEYKQGLEPNNPDSDADGLTDQQELTAGLDPLRADAFEDPDGDGYPNGFEVAKGTDWTSAASVPAPDFVVDPAGGGTHTTIKSALSAITTNFQIIQVAPGTYQGTNNTGLTINRPMMLISERGAAVTKIDGQGLNTGITMWAGGVLRGFTVRNCQLGLSVSADEPTLIENCVIADCLGTAAGGVSVGADGPVEFRHCTIVNNRSEDSYGAVTASGIRVQWGVVSLVNTICWNDPSSDILVEYGILTASHSNVREEVSGTGNLHLTPLLTSDYRLQADSPLRAAGAILKPAGTDMDGEMRPVGTPPDIGADQFVDTDGDSLPDAWEQRFFGSLGQIASGDPDADGLDNRRELNAGTNPNLAADADGDGLSDAQEILNYGSNPASTDSDGDGLPDKYEADNGLKPALVDDFEDADGDGYPNIYEYRAGANPRDPASIPNADFIVDSTGAGGALTKIQTAINSLTRNYQIIKVNPGVYRESINLFRWPALIISSQGAGSTVIDGDGIRRCVTLQSESALVGFHIRNGGLDRSGSGNGVNISAFNTNKHTLLQGCVFSNNRSVDGGAVYASSAKRIDVIVRRCTFLNNYAAEGGSALTVLSTVAPSSLRVFIDDSILWDQPPLELRNYNSSITVRNSVVRGGYAGTNVTSSDPRLTLSAHLGGDSPALGRASLPLYRDMDGELADSSPDIGADEFIDTDADGLPDWWELKYFGSLTAQNGTGDADGDGASNLAEYANETTPVQAADTDGDGLSDADEINIHHTDPTRADTDGDDMPDGKELQFGLDPLRDDAFDDADGDGYPNVFEVMRGSDPRSAGVVPAPDYTVALTLPRTHATVKAAVDAASNSGQPFRIIRVAPGTYSIASGSQCNFAFQKILLISAAGAAQTVLDGGSVQGFSAGLSIGTRSAIHGFTIRGVFSSSDGGAMSISTNARISNCVIRNNRAAHGAAMAVLSGHPVFVHCTLINNTALDSGAGLAFNALTGVELINSILWNPGAVTEIKGDGDLVAHNSIVRGASADGGGIDQDPRVTADGHLKVASPARGAGMSGPYAAKDLDDESRPAISPDIGADQFSGLGAADADEDGMLDSWETVNGLDPLIVDSYDDADGDGIPNVHEASHNTNPRDPASVPSADRVVVDPTPGVANPALGIYATLSEAIASLTQPYGIIEIRPGVHAAGVTVANANARGVLIRSSAGAAKTVLDGAGSTYGLSMATEAMLSGLTFANCSSTAGAALNIDAAQVKVANCVFRDNQVTGQGGAIWATSAIVSVVHCTFYRNSVGETGLGGAIGADGGDVQVCNSILWNTAATSEIAALPATAVTVRHSVIRTGTGFTDGGGNIGADPLLSPSFGHLRSASPAIDAGAAACTVTLDMDGEVRPAGAGPDMGADEYVDSDGDGLNDGWEKAAFGNLAAGPGDDADGDGLSNLEELKFGTDPQKIDTDGDGLSDRQEVQVYQTNPARADTDGDGSPDGSEVAAGLDPLQPDAYIDSDGDGLTNLTEIELGTKPNDKDTDGDGLPDGFEAPAGLNPLVADYVAPDRTPPPTPTGLQVIEVTPNTVRLSWSVVTDPSAPVTYEVWRNNLLIDRTGQTAFLDNYGEPGVYAFSYHVLAVDAEGNESAASATVEGSTASGFTPLPGDADGDGLLDAVDAEPNNPANAFADDDGDAIANRDDAQPTVYDGPPPSVKILNNDDRVNYLQGEDMRLTVRVSDPAANITVYRNGVPLGTTTPGNDGVGIFTWSNLPEGVHHLKAVVKDAKKAMVGTKTFLVDVAEVEAHITFVGPHPGEVYGRSYSIRSRLDGATVDRPILRNMQFLPSGRLADYNQGIDIHYERYYRGKGTIGIYAGGQELCSFKLPKGPDGKYLRYPLVMLRESRAANGSLAWLDPTVINPSAPADGAMLVKVANFSDSTILGGFTKYYSYWGVGGPDETSRDQRIQAHTSAVNSAMAHPAFILPQAMTNVVAPAGSGYMSFNILGDWHLRFRDQPEPPYEFPAGMVAFSPEWQAWFRTYGNMVYVYYADPSVTLRPGSRTLFCYYSLSPQARGIRWWSDVPILPEVRLTAFNVGSVAYPGGRAHPANNLVAFNLPLTVNEDADDQPGVADNADTILGAKDDDIVKVNLRVDLRHRTDAVRLRMKLPLDPQGNPVLRGFYGNQGQSLALLTGAEVDWLLADHPEITSDTGLDFYFEGLRMKFDARIEVDVLNADGVPINRIHPTQGDPETLRLDVFPRVELAVDANRDGEIKLSTEDTSDLTSFATPYRFWINDDIDRWHVTNNDLFQTANEQDDISPTEAAKPSNNWKLDCEDDIINSERDLEDFSRIVVSLKGLVDAVRPPLNKPEADLFIGLKWTGVTAGRPAIRLFNRLGDDGTFSYLTDPAKATAMVFAPRVVDARHYDPSNPAATVAPAFSVIEGNQTSSQTFIIPSILFVNLTEGSPTIPFLFEGVKTGKGQFQLVILKKDGTNYTEIGEGPSVCIDLQLIRNFYQTWTVGDITISGVQTTNQPVFGYSPVPSSTYSVVPGSPSLAAPAIEEEKDFVLFVHGWNMSVFEKDRFAETAFKRLWWQGYKGRFGFFRWPTFYTNPDDPNGIGPALEPLNFDASEWNSWRSATGLLQLLNTLKGTYKDAVTGNSRVRVLAHSHGNLATGEALRRAATSLVHTYVATQAAIAAHCYDNHVSDISANWESAHLYLEFLQHPELLNPLLAAFTGQALAIKTPNLYAYYPGNAGLDTNTQFPTAGSPYIASAVGAGKWVNYYNVNDWALDGWITNQAFKPDIGYFYSQPSLTFSTAQPGWWFSDQRITTAGVRLLSVPDDTHEIFAFAAQGRSQPLGRQPGVMGLFNGQQVSWNVYGDKHPGHSTQFRSSISERWEYWAALLDSFGIIERRP